MQMQKWFLKIKRDPTPAVIVGILLFIVVGAQNLLILLRKGSFSLTLQRRPAATMRLWPDWTTTNSMLRTVLGGLIKFKVEQDFVKAVYRVKCLSCTP